MTDRELAETAGRLLDQIPADDSEPDPSLKALLCEVFREWGRRDFHAAARFATQGDSEGTHLERPGHLLLLAVWAGYGETHPEAAWKHLRGTIADHEPHLAFPFDGSLEAIAVVESIFRQLHAQSPEAAAAPDHRFRNLAMGALISSTEDPGQRYAIMKKSMIDEAMHHPGSTFNTRNSIDAILNNPFRSRPELSLVSRALAGMAEQDPQQAWAWLQTETTRTSSQEALGFVTAWAARQPHEALDFFESMPYENDRSRMAARLVRMLLPTHPEQAIAYFSRMPAEDQASFSMLEMGMVHQTLLPIPQWPVVQGMKPGIPTAEVVQRLHLALDEHPLPLTVRAQWNHWLDSSD